MSTLPIYRWFELDVDQRNTVLARPVLRDQPERRVEVARPIDQVRAMVITPRLLTRRS
ncbi:MAG: hypothetical protein IPK97_10200 [Ahniella sp.]|nr:hypothetical protein [Ahniella sp.]